MDSYVMRCIQDTVLDHYIFDDGIKRFVPLTPCFQSNKWKRPLKEDIRDQIRLKKISGGHMFETEIIQVG